MTKYIPGFAVIRIARDRLRPPTNDAEFEAFALGLIKVVRVVSSIDEARFEVDRLNNLQAGKGDYYYYQHTHVHFSSGAT